LARKRTASFYSGMSNLATIGKEWGGGTGVCGDRNLVEFALFTGGITVGRILRRIPKTKFPDAAEVEKFYAFVIRDSTTFSCDDDVYCCWPPL